MLLPTAASRLHTTQDFGFVALDLKNATLQDADTYICRAWNKHGEAVTTCNVTVAKEGSTGLSPEEELRISKLNALEAKPQKRHIPDELVKTKPLFLGPLKNVVVMQGQQVHLETKVTITT